MRLGFIGLGKMGNRMVLKLLSEGYEVVVWNRSKEKITNFQLQIASTDYKDKLEIAENVEDLISKLESQDEVGPRIIWSMVPAGEPTNEILTEISKYAKAGDIVIDGGNAKYSDTQRRWEEFAKVKIDFLGIGVSGGIIAGVEGYPLMAGGTLSAYEYIKPILDSLAKPGGGHEYFGEGGAGHFVKMVHNAIEYGIMESIGEGFGLLEKSPYNLDLLKVARLYQKGTLVSGFMMARTIEVLEKDPTLVTMEGIIGKASGETIWAVEEAKEKDIPFEIIEKSLEVRNNSEMDPKIQKSIAAKIVAGLRVAFGGHENKKSSEK